jgi:uncharacterized protein with PQ loop repeat
VVRSGTVGDLPLLPYTTMTISCFVWIVYGILRGEPTLWVTNLVECTLSIYFVVEFTNYAPQQSKTFPGSVYHHIQGILGIGGMTLFLAIFMKRDTAIYMIGNLTIALTILTFASPLAAVQAVVESQSSESIPWPFTITALVDCILWSIVGTLDMHDHYVYFPAILGVLFALLQVALKVYYPDYHHSQDGGGGYTRAPVEMSNPILARIRQMVMLGNDVSTSSSSAYSIIHQHLDSVLQFDRMMYNDKDTATMSDLDYVEFGAPLTRGGMPQGHYPTSSSSTTTSAFAIAPHLGPRSSSTNDEYDNMESIVFDK